MPRRDRPSIQGKARFRTITDVDGNRQRCKVVRNRGFDGYIVRFTTGCSGCVSDEEGICQDVGCGCEECGYTGKRRQRAWIPFDHVAFDRHFDAAWERLERMRAACRRRLEQTHATT